MAIGGIKADNLQEITATAVRGVALVAAIYQAAFPRAAAQDLVRLIS